MTAELFRAAAPALGARDASDCQVIHVRGNANPGKTFTRRSEAAAKVTFAAKPLLCARFFAFALVAQLDRASDFEFEGREFESLRARQKTPTIHRPMRVRAVTAFGRAFGVHTRVPKMGRIRNLSRIRPRLPLWLKDELGQRQPHFPPAAAAASAFISERSGIARPPSANLGRLILRLSPLLRLKSRREMAPPRADGRNKNAEGSTFWSRPSRDGHCLLADGRLEFGSARVSCALLFSRTPPPTHWAGRQLEDEKSQRCATELEATTSSRQ